MQGLWQVGQGNRISKGDHMTRTKKLKLAFGDRLEVVWRDTSGGAAWHSLHEELPEPPFVEQMGYFLKANKDTIYLCQGIPNGKDAGECMILGPSAIPQGCVVSIKRLK